MLPPQEKYHSYFMSDYFLSFLTHVDFLCLFHNLLFCVSAEGAREEDLDAVEAQMSCKLPDYHPQWAKVSRSWFVGKHGAV